MVRELERRAEVHAALGDPVRLAIVEHLASSDRSPGELAERFDLAGNLLAHHLDTLERVGLIRRLVSTGDARRRYVSLVREPLGGLGIDAGELTGPVVFVCTQNSARSPLAAALWNEQMPTSATSAGTRPASRVHPGAVAAAERWGVDLTGVTPCLLDTTAVSGTVVTVCDRAHEELDIASGWCHWSIPDPAEIGTASAFTEALEHIEARIQSLN